MSLTHEHPYEHKLRYMAATNQRADALRAMSQEDRDAWFARVDATIARIDAVKAQDWEAYVNLGGEITPPIAEMLSPEFLASKGYQPTS